MSASNKKRPRDSSLVDGEEEKCDNVLPQNRCDALKVSFFGTRSAWYPTSRSVGRGG